MLRAWLSSVYVNTSVMLRAWLSSVYVNTSVMLRSWLSSVMFTGCREAQEKKDADVWADGVLQHFSIGNFQKS